MSDAYERGITAAFEIYHDARIHTDKGRFKRMLAAFWLSSPASGGARRKAGRSFGVVQMCHMQTKAAAGGG